MTEENCRVLYLKGIVLTEKQAQEQGEKNRIHWEIDSSHHKQLVEVLKNSGKAYSWESDGTKIGDMKILEQQHAMVDLNDVLIDNKVIETDD